MSQKAPHSLATKIAELAAQAPAPDLSPSDARQQLDALGQEASALSTFLSRKGTRLPEAQQQAVLTLLQAAEATEFAPTLQAWSQARSLSVPTRRHAVAVLRRWDVAVDAAHHSALQEAGALLDDLSVADATLQQENAVEALAPPLQGRVLDLPLDLALDLARDLSLSQPHHAIAVLQTLRPVADAQDRLAIVDRLAGIPVPESATVLHEMLGDTPNKAAQKAIKKALHRLKAQRVLFEDVTPGTSTVIGASNSRLEQCLASHIDPAGDRVFWMIRTKPFGGYHIAYLIVNYGQGIQHATGLSMSKRELPDLLKKASEVAPLIELST